ncbi:regulator of microtubule dynamics protein 1-like [Tropilaelaps mercedesae]|uniref:Regulator of microtubule dynamics protein 1 n=1 Tax=Tropilaelaps mercedesae TaxID=418985 RepID=A0A1V9X7B7_9ACAR|nr:regulator of microtubule dynamics protein 1-like [Tropilaelaps mercedesae]
MSPNEAVKKCDEFYEAGDMVEAHKAIIAVKDDPNPEVQWRVARMEFKVAEISGRSEDVTQAIQQGLEILRANLEKTPKCPNTHKWIAILLGSKDKHNSFKEQIEEAFLIREHLEHAIENNPTDGYAHYVLGKWCYQVASVSWYQKKIAATLFASPPESSYEIALGHFKEAEKLKPDIFSTCHLMAAQCLLNIGEKNEAAEYLRKCIAQEDRDAESKKTAAEAVRIAKKNSIKV